MLESYIRSRLAEKKILLMTHIVIGYPSLDASLEIVRTMVDAGVDLMELQIPFSEPIADGPVILKANQQALAHGVTVEQCLEFGRRWPAQFPIPFLYMTYYNISSSTVWDDSPMRMHASGCKGAIVPDLPPEEAEDYLDAMGRHDLDPIFIFSPTTSDARMHHCFGWPGVSYIAWPARGSPATRPIFPASWVTIWTAAERRRGCPWPGVRCQGQGDIDFSRARWISPSSAPRCCVIAASPIAV
jgi:tryptophan synthase alpha subunit